MVDASQINGKMFENSENTNGNAVINETLEEFVVEYVETEVEPPVKRTKLQVPLFIKRKSPEPSPWVPVEKPKQPTRLGIESICPDMCLFFLRDECVADEDCYNSHEFTSADVVRQNLLKLGVDNAGKLFHVIVARCPKLLHQYFSIFLDFFVEHKSKIDLLRTVAICEREPKQRERFEYFKQLINAFMRSGDTYTMSMHAVFFNLNKNMTIDVANTLLNMNLVAGISVDEFLGVFHSLLESRYDFHSHIISRLMYLCTQSEAVLSEDKLYQFILLIFDTLKACNRNGQKRLKKDWYECFLNLYKRVIKTQ